MNFDSWLIYGKFDSPTVCPKLFGKTYFKFNQITMRPAYNGEELFFEQNK